MATSDRLLVVCPCRHFNPRHPYGWRRLFKTHAVYYRYFNPRHPYGWRLASIIVALACFAFQSTPPIRVATQQRTRLARALKISIHATHTGGDIPFLIAKNIIIFNFNPRHPYGWRPEQVIKERALGNISIHATHTGGDKVVGAKQFNELLFQSTPPIRVATGDVTERVYTHKDFNPRHPYGWRRLPITLEPSTKEFQSTPPIRVATRIINNKLWVQLRFQSTPPIRVATPSTIKRARFLTHFNPRHPYGWRPVQMARESTLLQFQSTPPIRVATVDATGCHRGEQISIHATHTGGDRH